MDQLSLFAPHVLARRTDPDTSHAAARKAKSLREGHHAEILEVLRLATEPLNIDGIAIRTRTMTPVQVARRMHELLGAGLVSVAGTAPTATGRDARTYRVNT